MPSAVCELWRLKPAGVGQAGLTAAPEALRTQAQLPALPAARLWPFCSSLSTETSHLAAKCAFPRADPQLPWRGSPLLSGTCLPHPSSLPACRALPTQD